MKVFKQTIPADPFRIVQVFVHCLSCGLLMAMYTFFVKNFIFIESMDLGLMTGNTNALMDKLSLLLKVLKKQSDNLTLSAEKLTQNADNSSDALSKMTGTLEKISSEGDSLQEMIISVNNAVGNLKKGLKALEQFVIEQTAAIKEADVSFNNINKYIDENQKLMNTIAQAMDVQKHSANDNMIITNKVRDALVKTNDLAKEQTTYSESVADTMNKLVSSSDNVKQAVSEVVETADTNKNSVVEMEKQISVFKY